MYLQCFNRKGDIKSEYTVEVERGIAFQAEDDDFEKDVYVVTTTPGSFMLARKDSIISLTAPVRSTSFVCVCGFDW